MKINKFLVICWILFSTICSTNAYLFGIKSFDNSIENIQDIESKYDLNFPIVAFIFDPWSEKVEQTLNNLNEQYWTKKIYHISISPNSYSAKQVVEWKFDNEYKTFFQLVKKNNLKVIFRTMHEMNGWRYPRWSYPENFQRARIHVWNLSREIWLNQNNILFDMSVNHRDMPTKWTPSQTAKLITCNQKNKFTEIEHKKFISTWYTSKNVETKIPLPQSKLDKLLWKSIKYNIVWQTVSVAYPIYDITIEKKQNCYTFEDYYPGNKYVDIMWVTFYNRWKAWYNRHRLYPDQILNDKNRNTLKRLKSLNKPIFIDEVATTAVRYNWPYKQKTSQTLYQTESELKNKWLISLKNFMLKNPEILGMVYFNIDYTYWLKYRMIWEADRSIINLSNDKFYTWTYELYKNQNLNNKLYNLFNNNPKTVETSNTNSKQWLILADLLIKKFGVEESLKRIKSILKTTNNKKLSILLKEILDILQPN